MSEQRFEHAEDLRVTTDNIHRVCRVRERAGWERDGVSATEWRGEPLHNLFWKRPLTTPKGDDHG